MESIAQWFEGHQMTCYIKSATGVDCPGCGFQRAFADLLRGHFAEAWEHYPPIFPFLLTILLLFLAVFTKFKWRLTALMAAFFTTLAFVLVNFLLKTF